MWADASSIATGILEVCNEGYMLVILHKTHNINLVDLDATLKRHQLYASMTSKGTALDD